MRLPSQVEALERSVLGAILRDPNFYWMNQERLTAKVFAHPFHRQVIKEIGKLADANREFGIAALSARLPEQGDGVSTAGLLASLAADQFAAEPGADLVDELHEIYARRELLEMCQRGIKYATEADDISAIERLEKTVGRINQIGDEISSINIRSGALAVERILAKVEKNVKTQKTGGIPWFLPEMRSVLGDDLEYGWLIGLLADSGGGKTSFALQQALHTAQTGVPVLFLSGDQSEDDCYLQMVSQETWIESSAFRHGRLSQDEYTRFRRTLDFLRDLPIQIVEIESPRVKHISRWIQSFIRARGKGLVIIDHDDIVEADNPRDALHDKVRQIDRDLKAVIRKTGCVGLYLMQRNASASGRDNARPIDQDLVGGPRRRKSFDALAYIYRESLWLHQRARTAKTKELEAELHEKAERRAGEAEVGAIKTRFSKDNRSDMVKWEGRFTRYSSMDTGGQTQGELV